MMIRLVFPLALAMLLAGCANAPAYRADPPALNGAWHTDGVVPGDASQWWRRFGDPQLDSAVEHALAANLDIAAAGARLRQADAAARQAGAALLPQAALYAGSDRERLARGSFDGAVARRLDLPPTATLNQLGMRASWELDLFGGLRHAHDAARADAAAASADAAAVRLAIAAETVDAYLQLRGLQARLDSARHQDDTERKLGELVNQRLAQGLVSEREAERVSGEIAALDAALPPLRAAIAAQLNRLDVLTGHQAGVDSLALRVPAVIPLAPDPAGTLEPGALMRRRPDLWAAERRVAAANARIGMAVAEYYPHLSIGALLGTAAGAGRLLGPGAVQAGANATLGWRLFDFGRVDAEIASARGREAEALATYRGAVLRATEEVETALSNLAEGRREIAAREREVAALTRAREQTAQAYAGGILALIDVLDADRALFDANDRLAQARAATARASVAAVRALGGGWLG